MNSRDWWSTSPSSTFAKVPHMAYQADAGAGHDLCSGNVRGYFPSLQRLLDSFFMLEIVSTSLCLQLFTTQDSRQFGRQIVAAQSALRPSFDDFSVRLTLSHSHALTMIF